jgi:hypothetical protein
VLVLKNSVHSAGRWDTGIPFRSSTDRIWGL